MFHYPTWVRIRVPIEYTRFQHLQPNKDANDTQDLQAEMWLLTIV